MMTPEVVVVGGGITGLSCAHRLRARGVDVLVLESEERVGGKIETVRRAGYQFEAGPNTLMTGKPAFEALIAELGLEGQVVEASPAAKRRYVAMPGGLEPLPMNPVAMLTSPLLGLGGVLAAAGDLWRKRPADVPADESVAGFVRRRLGRRVLENMVGPFLTGVYAGDAERLEAASVLRTLVEAEREHGSVIRGMIAQRKAARAAGAARARMRSITFRDGLEVLPRALAESLGDRVRLGTRVSWLEATPAGACLGLSDGELIRCGRVVLATPRRLTASLIQRLAGGEEIADGLAQVRLAGLGVVGLGFEARDVPAVLDGFGYLAGPGSSGPVLGCLYRSTVFPHVAPAGKVLLLAFIGGVKHPKAVGKSPEELVAIVRQEIRARLGINAEPEQTFVRRWDAAIPQYERGHAKLAERVRRWSEPGPVSIIGNVVTGLSVPDCITAGRAEADRLAGVALSGEPSREAEACASA